MGREGVGEGKERGRGGEKHLTKHLVAQHETIFRAHTSINTAIEATDLNLID